MTITYEKKGNYGTFAGTVAASASESSEGFDCMNTSSIGVLVHSTQNGSVKIEQSPDGTNWDYSSTWPILANVGFACESDIVGLKFRVTVTNSSGVTATVRGNFKNRV